MIATRFANARKTS